VVPLSTAKLLTKKATEFPRLVMLSGMKKG